MSARQLIRRRTWALLAAAVIGTSALAAAKVEPLEEPAGTRPPSVEGSYGRSVTPADAQPGTYVQRSRYKTLLRKIEVADDVQSYGDFYDYGHYTGTSYREHTDLPAGYWVYVAPHWLIYKEDANNPQPQPPAAFGPNQATGAPNSLQGGDVSTAWASASADGQREWLELTFESPVEAVGVMVYENHCPGAVDCVIAYTGSEQVQVWAGKDPTEPGKPMGVSVMGFSTAVSTNRIRLNIDSPRVSGWNEIDAVGLIDKKGTVHWAVGATASSSYGAGVPAAVDPSSRRLLEGRLGAKSYDAPGLAPGGTGNPGASPYDRR